VFGPCHCHPPSVHAGNHAHWNADEGCGLFSNLQKGKIFFVDLYCKSGSFTKKICQALRLSHQAMGHTTAGQVVNLLSNDVNRFDVVPIFMHYLWIGPLETALCSYLMWRDMGWSALMGVATLLLTIPLQGKFTFTN
jgi:ABC transporter transmembrane region